MRMLSKNRVLALALVLALVGPAPAGARAAAPAGAIDVLSEPAGAAVFLDGEAQGVTPLSLAEVPAGEHRVRLALDGFVENSRLVNVSPGKSESLSVRLTPARPAAAIGEGWSTTTKAIVGAGAAAAVIGAILLIGGGSDAPKNAPPVPGTIGVSPSGLGLAGLTSFSFSAQGASDPENAPLSYSWSFGDGATGSGASVSHVYNNGGSFTVTLTVSDGTESASTTRSVQVGDVNGTWVNIAGTPGFPEGVTRRVRFTQSGAQLSGTYRTTLAPGNTGSADGRLSAPRNITFEARLKNAAGEQVGFTFTGTLNADLTRFTGLAKGFLLGNRELTFGRESE